jgi:3-oxoacyl-[acyl-carrier protein] reductase
MISFDFSNRAAIVTGAGGGMGKAIAKALAGSGCYVMAADVKSCPNSLIELPNVDFQQGDLTDEEFVNSLALAAHEKQGRLDYLCNVAGVLWFEKDKSIFEMDLDVWDQVFDINLKSMVYTTRACQPLMKNSPDGSAMVHFSTVQWMRGDAAPQDAYAASKAAVSAFSRSLAMQMAADNIRSNVICPGPTLTPMQARWDSEEIQINVADQIPLKRLGTPEDMANTTLFLLSDEAGYITGIDIPVDGGLLLRN